MIRASTFNEKIAYIEAYGIIDIDYAKEPRHSSYIIDTDILTKVIVEFLYSDSIEFIYIRIESLGGDGSGLYDAVEYVNRVKKEVGKKIFILSQSFLTSAAYWISLFGDETVISETCTVGSIGVFVRYDKEYLENSIFLVNTKSKDKVFNINNIENSEKVLIKELNSYFVKFKEQIIYYNRKATSENIDSLRGAAVIGKEALNIGLVDYVHNIYYIENELKKTSIGGFYEY